MTDEYTHENNHDQENVDADNSPAVSPRYVRSISEKREAKERGIVDEIVNCDGGDAASESMKAWARVHAPVAFQVPAKVEHFFAEYDRLVGSIDRMQHERFAHQQRTEDRLAVGGPIHLPRYDYRAFIKPNTQVASHYTLATGAKSRGVVKARLVRANHVVDPTACYVEFYGGLTELVPLEWVIPLERAGIDVPWVNTRETSPGKGDRKLPEGLSRLDLLCTPRRKRSVPSGSATARSGVSPRGVSPRMNTNRIMQNPAIHFANAIRRRHPGKPLSVGWREFDLNANGRISFQEFILACRKIGFNPGSFKQTYEKICKGAPEMLIHHLDPSLRNESNAMLTKSAAEKEIKRRQSTIQRSKSIHESKQSFVATSTFGEGFSQQSSRFSTKDAHLIPSTSEEFRQVLRKKYRISILFTSNVRFKVVSNYLTVQNIFELKHSKFVKTGLEGCCKHGRWCRTRRQIV